MTSLKAINAIKDLREKKYINDVEYVVCGLMKSIGSTYSAAFKSEKVEFMDTHRKIYLIKTQNNHYIIQSSGNFTFKYNIEFTTIQNNEKLYNSLKNG